MKWLSGERGCSASLLAEFNPCNPLENADAVGLIYNPCTPTARWAADRRIIPAFIDQLGGGYCAKTETERPSLKEQGERRQPFSKGCSLPHAYHRVCEAALTYTPYRETHKNINKISKY